jgi:hypothetical protein
LSLTLAQPVIPSGFTSLGFLIEVVTTQQHFPAEAPQMESLSPWQSSNSSGGSRQAGLWHSTCNSDRMPQKCRRDFDGKTLGIRYLCHFADLGNSPGSE